MIVDGARALVGRFVNLSQKRHPSGRREGFDLRSFTPDNRFGSHLGKERKTWVYLGVDKINRLVVFKNNVACKRGCKRVVEKFGVKIFGIV